MSPRHLVSHLRSPHTQLAVRLTVRRAVDLCGVVGSLLLADAPTYRTHLSEGRDFNTLLAIPGAILTLAWLAYRLGVLRGLTSEDRKVDLPSRRNRVWRAWQGLGVCACTFLLLSLLHAPIHLIAPVALATTGLCVCMFWQLARLSVALISRDRATPLASMRWLILVPASLIGLIGFLILAGDSWVTLLLGCLAACIGPICGGCVRRESRAPTPLADGCDQRSRRP